MSRAAPSRPARQAFGGFVIDVARRELLAGGAPVALQPQVFDLLAYLVQHRDRVVAKRELLEALWPDVTVTEGSLQRTMSLLRAALGAEGDALIQTFPRRGYRFVARVAPVPDVEQQADGGALAAAFGGPPRYVRSGGAHLAYRSVGEGETCLLLVPGWAFPMSAWAELAPLRERCAAMAELGRVVLYDRRGVGRSDPTERAAGLAERVQDALAVLDAIGATRAIVAGISEGAAMAIQLAAMHPERVRGLLLVGGFARWAWSPDHPHGWSEERIDALRAYIGKYWGAGATVRAMVPAHDQDPEVVRWAALAEQHGASPGAALDIVDVNRSNDVRAALASIQVPVVVLHQRRDPVIAVENGRELARRIPGARYLELPGDDHACIFDGGEVVVRELAALIARTAGEPATQDPILTSALVVALGEQDADAAEAVARALQAAGATSIESARGRVSGCFDGPLRALRCAAALMAQLGGRVGLGLDVGEAFYAADKLVGPALDGAALLATGPTGELRVSTRVAALAPQRAEAFGARVARSEPR